MIIFNSSTLILLAKVELLKEIVRQLEVVIPREVEGESTVKDTFDAKLIKKLIEDGKIRIARVSGKKGKKKLKDDFNIGEGEVSALLLAKDKSSPLATDDGPTIKACKILDVKFTTAIHFLIGTYENGILSKDMALAKLEKLEKYGRYSSRIIDDASRRIKGG
jgi:predicted nucleic acid-binding protein